MKKLVMLLIILSLSMSGCIRVGYQYYMAPGSTIVVPNDADPSPLIKDELPEPGTGSLC